MDNKAIIKVYNWNNYYMISLALIFLLLALFLLFYMQSLPALISFIIIGVFQFILNITYFRLKVITRKEPYLNLGGWSLPISKIIAAEANRYRVKIYYTEVSGKMEKEKSFYIKNPQQFISDWDLTTVNTEI